MCRHIYCQNSNQEILDAVETHNKKWLNLSGFVVFVDNISVITPAGDSTAVCGATVQGRTLSKIVRLLLHIRNPLVLDISDIWILKNVHYHQHQGDKHSFNSHCTNFHFHFSPEFLYCISKRLCDIFTWILNKHVALIMAKRKWLTFISDLSSCSLPQIRRYQWLSFNFSSQNTSIVFDVCLSLTYHIQSRSTFW